MHRNRFPMLWLGFLVFIVNSVHANGESSLAMHQYIKHQNDLAAQVLLHTGVSPHNVDKKRRTPLHMGALYGAGKSLFYALWNLNADLNAQTTNGETALHLACGHGNYRWAKLLIKQKANINAQDCFGRTPLHIAELANDIKMYNLLTCGGADPTIDDAAGRVPMDYALALFQQRKHTALKQRIEHGKSACAQILD